MSLNSGPSIFPYNDSAKALVGFRLYYDGNIKDFYNLDEKDYIKSSLTLADDGGIVKIETKASKSPSTQWVIVSRSEVYDEQESGCNDKPSL